MHHSTTTSHNRNSLPPPKYSNDASLSPSYYHSHLGPVSDDLHYQSHISASNGRTLTSASDEKTMLDAIMKVEKGGPSRGEVPMGGIMKTTNVDLTYCKKEPEKMGNGPEGGDRES